MERLINYLLPMVLVSGVLTGYYWVALRNRKLHGYNRGYLLGVFVLSVVLPLVRIEGPLLLRIDWQRLLRMDWLPFSFVRRPVIGEAVEWALAAHAVPSPA